MLLFLELLHTTVDGKLYISGCIWKLMFFFSPQGFFILSLSIITSTLIQIGGLRMQGVSVRMKGLLKANSNL